MKLSVSKEELQEKLSNIQNIVEKGIQCLC